MGTILFQAALESKISVGSAMSDHSELTSPYFSIEEYLDFVGVLLIMIAPDQTVKLANKKACMVLGYEEQEIVGVAGYQGIIRDVTERKRLEEEREKLIRELQEALAKVKILSGLLPICASCKKIRDDKGYWNQIEAYVPEHSEAKFSHSICLDCLKKLYPEFYPPQPKESEK